MYELKSDDPVCCHQQVMYYWIEAVRNKTAFIFPARKSRSYARFQDGACNISHPIGYMNTKTSDTLRGNYYLNTNKDPPFAKLTADPWLERVL